MNGSKSSTGGTVTATPPVAAKDVVPVGAEPATPVETAGRAPSAESFDVVRIEVEAGGNGVAILAGADPVERARVVLGGDPSARTFVEAEYPAIRPQSPVKFLKVDAVQELARYVSQYKCRFVAEKKEAETVDRGRLSLIKEKE